ncbi:MAG TPA: ribonuclease P protein component [Candidatus Cybelea sp.]|nr:ribonuclease P protein component [Candidatus Cybelea sp.]
MDERSLRNAAGKGATASRGSEAGRRSFPRLFRLLTRAEYDAVYADARRRSSEQFTVFVRSNALEFSRFGWSVKKGLGNAVRRNRIRRRLREMIRLQQGEIEPGWDIVIHPRGSVATGNFAALSRELLRLLPSARRPGR